MKETMQRWRCLSRVERGLRGIGLLGVGVPTFGCARRLYGWYYTVVLRDKGAHSLGQGPGHLGAVATYTGTSTSTSIGCTSTRSDTLVPFRASAAPGFTSQYCSFRVPSPLFPNLHPPPPPSRKVQGTGISRQSAAQSFIARLSFLRSPRPAYQAAIKKNGGSTGFQERQCWDAVRRALSAVCHSSTSSSALSAAVAPNMA